MRFIKYRKLTPVAEGYYFLINGLNGAVDVIDEAMVPVYQRWSCSPEIVPTEEEMPFYTFLLDRGYLCEGDEDEERKQELIQQLKEHIEQNISYDLVFVVTYDCNLRCTYCFEKKLGCHGKEWLQQKMTPEMVRDFYNYLDRQGVSVRQCLIFGGEPLLPENTETVFEILEQNTRRGYESSITTNAYHLVDFVKQLRKYKIGRIQITLDGVREEHDRCRMTKTGEGTFHRIMQGIQAAHEAGFSLMLRHNHDFSQESDDKVKRLATYLQEIGLVPAENIQLYVSPVFGKDGSDCTEHILTEYLKTVSDYDNIPELIQNLLINSHTMGKVFHGKQIWLPKYMYCSASRSKWILDPTGSIYPCEVLIGQEENAIGYFDGHEITLKPQFELWRSRTIEKMAQCKDCWALFICGGGCGLEALQRQGDVAAAECTGNEALLNTYLPFLFHKYVKPILAKQGGENNVSID